MGWLKSSVLISSCAGTRRGRYRRTPARDAQQSSHEFASPPEDPQHAQASVWNCATSPGPTPTRKLGCYMLAALSTVPKTTSPANAVDGSEFGDL